MQTRILGTTMPVLEVLLDPNESVFSESGELSWMTASMQMTTHTQAGGGGGFFGVIKRVAGGGSIFMTEYRAIQCQGSVSFATRVPGHIVPVQLGQGPEYMVHRHGFLCATPQVTIGVGFQQSLGAGIFGGNGFLLQKVGGVGTAWIELSGELIQKDLAPGEILFVHPGPCGRVPIVGWIPDHHGSGDQEHDLRRRRNLSGADGGSGHDLAANAAHFAAGDADLRVSAASRSGADAGCGSAGRNRRRTDQRAIARDKRTEI